MVTTVAVGSNPCTILQLVLGTHCSEVQKRSYGTVLYVRVKRSPRRDQSNMDAGVMPAEGSGVLMEPVDIHQDRG